jgi:hypothetical protein
VTSSKAPLGLVAGFLFAAGIASACVLPGSTSSSSTGTGGSGGSTTTSTTSGLVGCDAQSTCDACTQCASKGACATQVSACLSDAVCSGLDQCVGLCGGDNDCKTQCYQQNQAGLSAYNAAYGCLYCTACPHACKGFATCQ